LIDRIKRKKVTLRNIYYFIISKWSVVKPKLKYLYKFKIHPQFTFSLREKFIHTNFDQSSSWRAKNSGNPNETFFQLISDNKNFIKKLDIYTNGSKFSIEQGNNRVGCAIFIPQLNLSFSYKLNSMTSSYMMEVLVIDKIVNLIKSHSWLHVQYSLRFLEFVRTLKNSETILFPNVLNNIIIIELIYNLQA